MKEDVPGTSLPSSTIKVWPLIHQKLLIKYLPADVLVMSIAKNTRKQRNKQKMTNRESLTKLNTVLPYNPAIIRLDIYLTDLTTFALHTNVYGNFIHGPRNWELQWCPSLVNGSRTVDAIHNGILFSDKKGMNYQDTQRCGWILNAVFRAERTILEN